MTLTGISVSLQLECHTFAMESVSGPKTATVGPTLLGLVDRVLISVQQKQELIWQQHIFRTKMLREKKQNVIDGACNTILSHCNISVLLWLLSAFSHFQWKLSAVDWKYRQLWRFASLKSKTGCIYCSYLKDIAKILQVSLKEVQVNPTVQGDSDTLYFALHLLLSCKNRTNMQEEWKCWSNFGCEC